MSFKVTVRHVALLQCLKMLCTIYLCSYCSMEGCWCGCLFGARCEPSWCHHHSLSLASVKSRLVLPIWYRLIWVVPDKGPLNGCVCYCSLTKSIVCILLACSCRRHTFYSLWWTIRLDRRHQWWKLHTLQVWGSCVLLSALYCHFLLSCFNCRFTFMPHA